MSDDPRFDVAYGAILNSGHMLNATTADQLAHEVVDALRAFDSTHASDRSLGVRRWDVMAHESRVRQQIERAVRALPYEGIEDMGAVVSRRSVLDIVKGPISE